MRDLGIDRIATSTEPKAIATADVIADALERPCETVHDLHEHQRRTAPFFQDPNTFRRAVFDALAHPDELRFGEETANQAKARFTAALTSLQNSNPTETLCVVAHGTVISLYAAEATGLDPAKIWPRLKLPSAVILDNASLDLLLPTPWLTGSNEARSRS